MRDRDELVELVVRWVMGQRLDPDDLDAVAPVGVDFAAQGLATIEKVDSRYEMRSLVESSSRSTSAGSNVG